MYDIHTHHGTNVSAEDWNHGSDGFVHAKNGSRTVASIPRENVAGVFPR